MKKNSFLAFLPFYVALLLSVSLVSSKASAYINDEGYIFHLSLSKPLFTQLDYFDETYGTSSVFPSLAVTYKLVNVPYATLGLGFKLSYYTDQGTTLIKTKAGDYVSNDDARTAMKLLPYQFYLLAQFSPFHQRYIVLDAWVGYEELYYEEVRVNESDSSSSSSSSSSDTDTTPNDINSGWNKSITYGLSLHFLLNQFDDQSARALEKTTGLRFIYMGPSIEYVQALSGGRTFISQKNVSPVDFSRVTYSLVFAFET